MFCFCTVVMTITQPTNVASLAYELSSSGLCSSFKVNCSKPDQPSLLAALSPVFDLMAIRPVMNQTTHTTITMYFTLYGILGVVCSVSYYF